jgi:hypothetical protein
LEEKSERDVFATLTIFSVVKERNKDFPNFIGIYKGADFCSLDENVK